MLLGGAKMDGRFIWWNFVSLFSQTLSPRIFG